MKHASLARWLRTLRHVPARKLLHRARRLLRQAWHEARAPHARAAASSRTRGRTAELLPELPGPLFEAPVRRLAGSARHPRARLLDVQRALSTPFDWHPRAGLLSGRLLGFQAHAMEYLPGLADAHFVALVEDWVRANPRRGRRAWHAAWHPYPLSIRCVVWLQELARRRARLAADFVGSAGTSLAEQARHLERELEHDVGGNHLLKNAKALLWLAAGLRDRRAGAWRARAEALLGDALREQVLGDGLHFERSPSYHAQVFADLLECRALLRPGELREHLAGTLDAMAQALRDLTHPDGLPSQLGDGGLGLAPTPGECLAVHASQGGRTPLERAVFALEAAGYFGARAGRDLVLVDCGALAADDLPAHGHADALSFEWSLDGARLIVDAGSSHYEGGRVRARERGTRAHNTLTVDDADQGELWGSFRLGRRPRVVLEEYRPARAGFVLAGTHDGFAHLIGAPRHARRFRVTARSIEIEDRVHGGAGQPVRARLLLHPLARIALEPGGARLERGPSRARLACDKPLRIESAWWSPDLGRRLATQQIVIELGPAPCVAAYRLSASPRVESPRPEGAERAPVGVGP